VNVKNIKELLRKENPLILEVGAHVGNDTRIFLQEFKDIKIYCFEPDPRCIKIFENTITDDRCTLIEAAVSNADGKTILHLSKSMEKKIGVPSMNYLRSLGVIDLFKIIKKKLWQRISKVDSLGQASIKKAISKSERYPWLIFDQNINIETVRLDTFIEKNDIFFVDFIWSDVQGAERDMIEGATNTLKITKYVYMEYGETSPYPEALTREGSIELVKSHGFDLVEKYSSKTITDDLLFINRRFS